MNISSVHIQVEAAVMSPLSEDGTGHFLDAAVAAEDEDNTDKAAPTTTDRTRIRVRAHTL